MVEYFGIKRVILLFANDKLYTISYHAEEEMENDTITSDEVIEVLEDADTVELSRTSGANVYIKRLAARTITVIADDEHDVIVTAFVVRLL